MVDVNVDPATGEVTYTVSSGDSEAVIQAQEMLASTAFVENINEDLAESLPEVEVISTSVEDDFVMTLDVVVSASDASNDIVDVNAMVEDLFEEEGFETDVECNCFYFRTFYAFVLSQFCHIKSNNFSSGTNSCSNSNW